MRTEFIGNEAYGGWTTIVEGLTPQSIVYSFGVGTDVSWDLGMIDRFGMPIFAYDPNPLSVQFVKNATLPAQFRFSPVGIARRDGTQRFWGRVGKISTSTVKKIGNFEELPVRSLATLMRENGHDRIDVLKLDIEGSEFSVLPAVARLPVKQLLVELHTRFYRDGLKGLRRLYGAYLERRAMRALGRAGFTLVVRSKDDYTFYKKSV